MIYGKICMNRLLIETDREWTEEELYASPQFRGMLAGGEEPIVRLVRKGVKHVLSHRVIYANFYEVILPENSASFCEVSENKRGRFA